MASQTTIKVRVAYLAEKVKKAREEYLKKHAANSKKFAKELADWEKRDKAYKAQLLAIVQKGLEGTYDMGAEYSRVYVACGNEVIKSLAPPGRKPEDNEPDTRKFDVKLSMLEGAAEEVITIKVEDAEWAQFL